MEGLTAKQRRFCEEYVYDWNATRAAKAAGYSEKTAYAIGIENLKKLEIKKYIDEIQNDLKKLAGVSALRNAQEYAKIAYSNMSDFKNGWMTDKEFEELTEDQKAALSEVTYIEKDTQHGVEKIVKFKLHDKQKALDSLNKMFGFDASEKIDITTQGEKIQQLTPSVIVKPRAYDKE